MPGIDGGGEQLLDEGEEGGFPEALSLGEGEGEETLEFLGGVRV